MSNIRSQMPAFGISGRTRRAGYSDEPPLTHSAVESTVKIPILDLQSYAQTSDGQTGEMILNQHDSLLYYYTGHQWVPLAAVNMKSNQITELLSQLINLNNRNLTVRAPDTGNICLVAGNNAPSVGGDVHISAGQGGFADGEIYLDVAGDNALTIKNTADVIVNAGDMVIKSGNLEFENPTAGINCNVARAEITAVTVQTSQPLDADDSDPKVTLPDATLDSMTGILTINLELQEGESLSGQIQNTLLQEDSWVGLTIVNSGSGVPHAWLDVPGDGLVRYHIQCQRGELSQVQLHLDVRNSL